MSSRGVKLPQKTKTQQQFKDDNKVSNVVQKFLQTGIAPMVNQTEPKYLDISGLGDFTEQLNRVTEVTQAFQGMHSSIRARFENKPQNMLHFMEDEKNIEEAIQLGLIPPQEPTTSKTEPKATKTPSTPEASTTPLKEETQEGEK